MNKLALTVLDDHCMIKIDVTDRGQRPNWRAIDPGHPPEWTAEVYLHGVDGWDKLSAPAAGKLIRAFESEIEEAVMLHVERTEEDR